MILPALEGIDIALSVVIMYDIVSEYPMLSGFGIALLVFAVLFMAAWFHAGKAKCNCRLCREYEDYKASRPK